MFSRGSDTYLWYCFRDYSFLRTSIDPFACLCFSFREHFLKTCPEVCQYLWQSSKIYVHAQWTCGHWETYSQHVPIVELCLQRVFLNLFCICQDMRWRQSSGPSTAVLRWPGEILQQSRSFFGLLAVVLGVGLITPGRSRWRFWFSPCLPSWLPVSWLYAVSFLRYTERASANLVTMDFGVDVIKTGGGFFAISLLFEDRRGNMYWNGTSHG